MECCSYLTMNNNYESFDNQLPITFWLARACGLIFYSDNSHRNGYYISAYIISVLFILIATYCRISVLLFDGGFIVENDIFSTCDTTFLVVVSANFYGKLINMYWHRKDLKTILTKICSFERRRSKSNIIQRHFEESY